MNAYTKPPQNDNAKAANIHRPTQIKDLITKIRYSHYRTSTYRYRRAVNHHFRSNRQIRLYFMQQKKL